MIVMVLLLNVTLGYDILRPRFIAVFFPPFEIYTRR